MLVAVQGDLSVTLGQATAYGGDMRLRDLPGAEPFNLFSHSPPLSPAESGGGS